MFGIFLILCPKSTNIFYFLNPQQTSGGEPAESPRSTRGETAKEIAERHIQKVTKIQRAWEVLTDDKEYPKCIVRKQQKKYGPEKLQCTYMYKKYGKKEIKMRVQPVGTTTKSYPA